MDVVETELCDYLQVRHVKLESSPSSTDSLSPPRPAGQPKNQRASTQLPAKFYKHWTTLWAVLHVEISPNYSFIGHCKKEADWLMDNQTISRCCLDETFRVERPPPGYSKKYENVLQLLFKGYQLDLGFDSMTKLDQWFKALQVTSDRHHVDLVRCHEHEHLEGEYVIQVCPNSYVVWSPAHKPCTSPTWLWNLKHIRRVHWHKNVNKLEVEPGRSSDTGEGHFYFTGQHAYRLFKNMKHMMSTHSQISSPLPSRPDHRVNGAREGGSGSESDWTGTGDDWTGASSDSAFFSSMRSRYHGDRFASPGGSASSSSPPPLPRERAGSLSAGDGIYTNLSPSTMNKDSQYCSIDRLQQQLAGISTKSPSPNRGALPTSTRSLSSVSELGESTEEDEYCKMVSHAGIRAGLAQQDPNLMSPMAAHRSVPMSPIVTHKSFQSPVPGHRVLPPGALSPQQQRPKGIVPPPVPIKHNSTGQIYTPSSYSRV